MEVIGIRSIIFIFIIHRLAASKLIDLNTVSLNLNGEGWSSIDNINFSNYPNVVEIDLSNNNIKYIKENIFQNNPKLKKLNLAYNKQLSLPMFSTLLISTIEELNLTSCNIYELPSNIFDGLQNLKIIDLRNNPLQNLDPLTFNVLLNPQILYLPDEVEEFVGDICMSVETLTINVISKETTKSYKCINNTINQEYVTKENQTSTSNQEKTNKNASFYTEQDFLKFESNNKFQEKDTDIFSEQMYFVGEEQNDQPFQYESSGEEPLTEEQDDISFKSVITETKNSSETIKSITSLKEQSTPRNTSNESVDDKVFTPSYTSGGNFTNLEYSFTSISTSDVSNNETVNEEIIKQENENSHMELNNKTEFLTNSTSLDQKLLLQTDKIEPSNSPIDMKNKTETLTIITLFDPKLLVHTDKIGLSNTSEINEKNNKEKEIPDKIEDSVNLQSNDIKKGEIKSATSSESLKFNSNVFIILGIAVVSLGVAAFGYRWYRNRSYGTTNIEEPKEKELKEIQPKAARREQEPLMNES